jgi:[ribosomal protein S5]-alanine N-acetyltransferase
MPELQRLQAGHAREVLAFELANRAYFAASVSDRGDDFFDQFTARYDALLAEQEAGICAFYVLVAEDGSILGRFNLVDIEDHTAELGFRVAQRVAGRGVATATVRELCRVAAARHGLRTVRAATACRNAASQKVLIKAGFVPVGPTDPAHLGGKPGTWYERDLVLESCDPAGGPAEGRGRARPEPAERHDLRSRCLRGSSSGGPDRRSPMRCPARSPHRSSLASDAA